MTVQHSAHQSPDSKPGSTLLVLDALPLPLTQGDRLRSFHIARALAAERGCVLAAPGVNTEYLDDLNATGIFKAIRLLPVRPKHGRWQRRFRTDNGIYLKTGWPQYLDECGAILREIVDLYRVDLVLGVNLSVAEFVAQIPGVYRVLDDFDCYTLTLERELKLRQFDLLHADSIRKNLALLRYRRQESRLDSFFDLVTTIAPPDAERLRVLSPRALIKVIPNGVNEGLLEFRNKEPELTNAIAFWGNLKFQPNRSAVKFFVDEVYEPHLAHHDINCFFIGGGADEWMKSLPQRLPKVRVTGFVEDLAPVVSRIPIMVNPMVSGSGLKNKLLEAFALGRAVVSTSMGSESVDAEPGQHFRLADDPKKFADEILELIKKPEESRKLGDRARQFVAEKYTWGGVEKEWRNVLASVRAMPRRRLGDRGQVL